MLRAPCHLLSYLTYQPICSNNYNNNSGVLAIPYSKTKRVRPTPLLLGTTSLNVDSLIGSMLPKIESTCLTTIIGLEI